MFNWIHEFKIIPYLAFLIFFIIIFLLTSDDILNWLLENCKSKFWTYLLIALVMGCVGFIWTGLILKYYDVKV